MPVAVRASTTGAKKPPCLLIDASKTLVTIKWGPAYSVSFELAVAKESFRPMASSIDPVV